MMLRNLKYFLLFFSIVIIVDGETAPSQVLVNQWDIGEGRLRPRVAAKPIPEPTILPKVKCDICNKFYREDYVKVSFLSDSIDRKMLISCC
jgi:hypothetical protein